MQQNLGLVSLLVRDYDEAISFFTGKLGFRLNSDQVLTDNKRWVVVTPPGSGCSLLLAKAANAEQAAAVGRQTGGRVFLFLYTDDLERDYRRLREQGVQVIRNPVSEVYGRVLVFADLYGNLWDLIQPVPAP